MQANSRSQRSTIILLSVAIVIVLFLNYRELTCIPQTDFTCPPGTTLATRERKESISSPNDVDWITDQPTFVSATKSPTQFVTEFMQPSTSPILSVTRSPTTYSPTPEPTPEPTFSPTNAPTYSFWYRPHLIQPVKATPSLSGSMMFNTNITSQVIDQLPEPTIHPFLNYSTPELRQHVLQRLSWTPQEWVTEIDAMLKLNYFGKWVIVAFVDKRTLEMTMNYIASLERTGYDKFMMICVDVMSYTVLSELGYFDRVGLVPRDWLDTRGLNDMGLGKWMILVELLKMKHSVCFNDVNLVYLNNHVVDYVGQEDSGVKADLWFMFDEDEDFFSELTSQPRHKLTLMELDEAFWAARPAQTLIAVINAAIQQSTSSNVNIIHPLEAMRTLLERDYASYYYRNVRRLTRGLFLSGEIAMNQQNQVRPMVVHVNAVDQAEKKKWLQKHNLWYIGEMFAGISARA